MAPDEQKHIGSIIWFGDSMKKDIDMKKVALLKANEFSQDNLFHTLLGLFEVDSSVYKKEMNMLKDSKIHE